MQSLLQEVFIIVLDGKGVEDHETVYKAFKII